MTTVQDLFEVHLSVEDLDRSVAFYGDRLGLPLARRFPEREVAFFWLGAPGNAMLGLWRRDEAAHAPRQHTAFRVPEAEVLAAPAALRAAGITPLDFDREPTTEPVVLAWMPAVSVYFLDPDGHLLEYLAMLDAPPKPEIGVVTWSAWRRIVGAG